MAEKRMISKSVARTDAFLSMPLSAQALYFHLNLEADDEGFVGNPLMIVRMTGAKAEDLQALVNSQYVINFKSGIIVITHWKVHNTIKNDRRHETIHSEEKKLLRVNENKVYSLRNEEVQDESRYSAFPLDPDWNHIGSKLEPEYSIGKDSIDKDSVGEYSNAPTASQIPTVHTPPSFSEVEEYCKGKNVDAEKFFKNYETAGWKVKDGRSITDWKALVDHWDKTERPKPEPAPEHKPSYGDLSQYEKCDPAWMQDLPRAEDDYMDNYYATRGI